MKKAVQALQAFLKTKSTSDSLFLDETQQISLLFTLWKIPKVAQTIRMWVQLHVWPVVSVAVTDVDVIWCWCFIPPSVPCPMASGLTQTMFASSPEMSPKWAQSRPRGFTRSCWRRGESKTSLRYLPVSLQQTHSSTRKYFIVNNTK